MANGDERVQVGICLSAEDLALLDARASRLGATRSGYIVALIRKLEDLHIELLTIEFDRRGRRAARRMQKAVCSSSSRREGPGRSRPDSVRIPGTR